MAILDPLLNPLLNLSPLVALIIISFFVAIVMTLIYKWMTDQSLMKILKEDMKSFQKEMKELRDHPAQVMEVQKRAMATNMKYMTQSMKPTLVTFLPIILIFGWLNMHLAYMPITPDNEFSTFIEFETGMNGEIEIITPKEITLLSGKTVDIENSKAFWTMKGKIGQHMVEYKYKEKSYNQLILITNDQMYEQPVKKIDDNSIKTLNIGNQKMKPLNLFGWQIGWLGTYIIFSILFSMSLRKLLKLH